MSAAHTPGPWVVGISADNEIHCVDVVHSDGVMEICEVWGTKDDKVEDAQSRANARLIAAAPELLEALQTLLARYVGLVESGDAGFWDAEEEPAVMDAGAAIAKATQP